MPNKIRVLLAKPGLDGHDRGIKVIAAALRDAGMEVIYTGLRQTPLMIVDAAIQEDVDAIGVSILSGAHMTLFPAILDELKKKDAGDIMLFGGGIIPDDDKEELEKMGVAKIFTPGAPTEAAIEFLKEAVAKKKGWPKEFIDSRSYIGEFSVIEKLYRDQRVLEIYEGTSEVQRLVIAGNVIGR